MSLYAFPDLSKNAVQSRLKRVERTVQYRQRGQVADVQSTPAGSGFRTVASECVDRDGKILASAVVGTLNVNQVTVPVSWGGINGNLTNQADLQAVLDTIPTLPIAESDVTGLVADLAALVIPLSVAFVINDGSSGTGIGPDLPAGRAGSLTKSKIVTKAADGATALTFTIKKNGTGIFTATVTAGTPGGTLATTTFAAVPVVENDIFTIDISSGTSSWAITVVLE